MNELKAPGLNNPETYVITHNRFNTYMVLIFDDLNKAQIYKMPYRDGPYQEIEKIMSFDYKLVFGDNNYDKIGNILFVVEDKKFIHVGKDVISFETTDEYVDYVLEYGNNDVKYPIVYGEENTYFILHRKYIPVQEHISSSIQDMYDCLYKKNMELKGNNTIENEGVIEYGKDFLNCKIIHSKQI